MTVQAALNGDREAHEHPSLTVTPTQLVADAVACAAAGAASVHLHPRGPDGTETLDSAVVDAVAAAARAQVTRCLVEPYGDAGVAGAFEHAAAIHAVLDAAGVSAPRLQHADGDAAWPLVRDALARGLQTRVGFEDVLVGPDGEPVDGNAALVRHALTVT